MSAIEARVVGIVSIAPTTEMSGQGRVLAQLVDVAGTNKAIIFSEEAAESSLADGTGVRLSSAGRSFAASIRKRAAEIAHGAVRTDCTILIACSGSPYDLTAAALAARYLSLPFLAYLFDDPVFQWPIGPLRTAAARLQRMWLPLAKTVIVPNEFLADEWRKRGAASISIVRNAATDLERCADGRGAALLAGGAGLTIAYTGSVYRAQADAFRNLLSALEVMHDQFHLHIFTSQAPSTVTGFWNPRTTCNPARSRAAGRGAGRSLDCLNIILAARLRYRHPRSHQDSFSSQAWRLPAVRATDSRPRSG